MNNIQDYFIQIEKFIDEKAFKKAYDAAIFLADSNPNDAKVHRFLDKVNKRLSKEIKKEIDGKISQTKYLWDDREYKKLLKIYLDLNTIYPGYSNLEDKIEKLKELADRKSEQEVEKFIDFSFHTLKKMFKERDYTGVIRGCHEFFKFDRSNKKILKIYQKARYQYIKSKFPTGMLLIDKKFYDKALYYFEQLYHIAPDDRKIKKIILDLQNKLHLIDLSHKKSLIEKKYILINSILKEKKYDDAVRNLNNVLLIDNKHKKTRRLLANLNRKVLNIINDEIYNQLIQAHRILRAEYALNKNDIIQI
ncbi:MAG: hypothetical protein UR27_C0001G0056 [Candidatus Peregrinibacteria bacterium GW2011_GWA2_33_10]|nr:MAG: hypothetical protein UR27_C0001G0056 [Candidatus Peregrinibacteria bacterium GW2011_GWA2_33_10]KKP39785.1 MAG: hypothetical protein UR30_C0008G0054 [Candidatus Peregrinibacteria bacterium GW2011_GWC2_33_13]